MTLSQLNTTLVLSLLAWSFPLSYWQSAKAAHHHSSHHHSENHLPPHIPSSEIKALKEKLEQAREESLACFNQFSAQRVGLYTCETQLQNCISNASGTSLPEENLMTTTIENLQSATAAHHHSSHHHSSHHHSGNNLPPHNPSSEIMALKEKLEQAREESLACFNRLSAQRVGLYTCQNQLQNCISNASGTSLPEENLMTTTIQK